jgi:glycosyltransferase involved in cell wall biosynthesis
MRDEVRSEFRIGASTKFVSCAARLEAEKNIDVLIDAFKIVVEQGTNATLIIMGEGSQRNVLQQRITELGLSDNVVLSGFRPDVHNVIAASDAFVLPSANEPFGLVLLEAMSLGVPTIAASSGGPLEIIDDGVTGFLFRPNNADNLSKQLMQVLDDTDDCGTLRICGKQVVMNEFSSLTMANATSMTYSAMIAEGRLYGQSI